MSLAVYAMSLTRLTFLLCGVIVKIGSSTTRESSRERSKNTVSTVGGIFSMLCAVK